MSLRAFLVGTVVLIGGCQEAAPPAVSPVPVAKPVPASGSPADQPAVTTEATEKHIAGVTLTIPVGWEERPPASEFIQAEYRLSGDAGPARLTMSSTGGGVAANLERWYTQFTRAADDPQPWQSTVMVEDVEATILELTGTFRDGFSGEPPKSNWSLLGAAIPTGPATFFVKLTGPRETVADRRDEFLQLIKTARLSP